MLLRRLFLPLEALSSTQPWRRKYSEWLYNSCLWVVLGGVLSQTLEERELDHAEAARQLEHERQAGAERRRALQQAYTDLLASYNGAKRVRRLLRGTAIHGDVHAADASASLSEYRRLIETLIDIQLDLEALKRRGRAGLWVELKGVAEEAEKMEKYLGRIIGEYENQSPSAVDIVPLNSLPRLAEFVGPYRDAKEFRSRFMTPHTRALRDLSSASEAALQRSDSELGAIRGRLGSRTEDDST